MDAMPNPEWNEPESSPGARYAIGGPLMYGAAAALLGFLLAVIFS
jgi:hypothetical protein